MLGEGSTGKEKHNKRMKIIISRYYGDGNVTKSTVTALGNEGQVLWQGEAREPQYKDYGNDDKVNGCTYMCAPKGEYACKISSTESNALCVRPLGMKGHRGCLLYFDSRNRIKLGHILMGYADEDCPAEMRNLIRVEEAKEVFIALLYQQICNEVSLLICNEGCVIGSA